MNRDVARRETGQALFRATAARAAGYRLFGGINVIVPPSASMAMSVSVIVVVALAAVTYMVEIPRRSRAVGVLMPVGGLIDVVANEAGYTRDIHVGEGESVEPGDLLITVSGSDVSGRGRSIPELALSSLRLELELLNDAHARQQEISGDRILSLQLEVGAASKRRGISRQRLESHEKELALLEQRFARWRNLVDAGHVAKDAFDLEYAALMKARASRSDIEQALVDIMHSVEILERSRQEVQKQIGLREVEHRMSVGRLQREIDLGIRHVTQEYLASAEGVVAHVLVRPGAAVRPGQVLAKLHRTGERLEAWLYLPTTRARILQPGQSVEIRLDAYPQQFFGTFTAIVSSVSGVALLPDEIGVPLALAGPVFEIRARLHDTRISAYGTDWPLPPGTSFQADIIQRRLKLYEWLLYSLVDSADDGHA